MTTKYFAPFAGAILCACLATAFAQTSPVGQSARRTPTKKPISTDVKCDVADQVANISKALNTIAGGGTTSAAEPCLPKTKATTKLEPPNPLAPSGLTLGAAQSQAAAAAKDADAFATNVTKDVQSAPSASSTRKDYEDITDSATAADAVVNASKLADSANDKAKSTTDPVTAVKYAEQARNAADAAQAAFNLYLNFKLKNDSTTCVVSGFDSKSNPTYSFRVPFPLWTRRCSNDAVLAYYNVSQTATVANQAQYLYNAAQSTNQVSADLLTTTFPFGVQVVLAGTATAGSSQAAGDGTSTDAAAVPASMTDSVMTAVSKLEQGGDFNLRVAYPLAQYIGTKGHFSVSLYPNLGFSVNGLSSQATITESTDYVGNIPVEFYGEFGSIPTAGTPAVLYADAKFGGEFIINSHLATSIGTGSTFYLGQYSAGIAFSNSVRIGFQYFQGPKQAYCVPNTTGCTQVTGSMSGVHLVVSFSPPSK